MVLFPNKTFTAVFSASNNAVVVNNVTQSLSTIRNDHFHHTARFHREHCGRAGQCHRICGRAHCADPPPGQPPGLVEVLDLSSNRFGWNSGGGARFVALSHNGNRLLALGNRADTVTANRAQFARHQHRSSHRCAKSTFRSPGLGNFQQRRLHRLHPELRPRMRRHHGQRHPARGKQQCAWAHDSLGCRYRRIAFRQHPLRGRHQAGCTCSGSSTPTQATTCGEVSVVDLVSMTVTATATITDGNHNHMEMGANNQLFIGARTCTNINVPASGNNPGIRGCLSIFDTGKQPWSCLPSGTSREFSPSPDGPWCTWSKTAGWISTTPPPTSSKPRR